MVRQWQQTFYGERYSHSRMNEGMPDFVQLAKAFGIKGICIKNKNELKPYIEQIFSLKEPIVIDCQVSKEENCYPMVAPDFLLSNLLISLLSLNKGSKFSN
eukprot:jgi/Galph1/1565/GphlegSOOS_G248.1